MSISTTSQVKYPGPTIPDEVLMRIILHIRALHESNMGDRKPSFEAILNFRAAHAGVSRLINPIKIHELFGGALGRKYNRWIIRSSTIIWFDPLEKISARALLDKLSAESYLALNILGVDVDKQVFIARRDDFLNNPGLIYDDVAVGQMINSLTIWTELNSLFTSKYLDTLICAVLDAHHRDSQKTADRSVVNRARFIIGILPSDDLGQADSSRGTHNPNSGKMVLLLHSS